MFLVSTWAIQFFLLTRLTLVVGPPHVVLDLPWSRQNDSATEFQPRLREFRTVFGVSDKPKILEIHEMRTD